jgi:chaperonin GroES
MNNNSIKPMADRVLIKPKSAEQKTVSGIIIPETRTDKQSLGEIIAVGDDCKTLQTGDVVLYQKNLGHEVDLDGVKSILIYEEDILAIVK